MRSRHRCSNWLISPSSTSPDMPTQNKGRNVLVAFEEDVGAALAKACELDSDKSAVHLARAAQIVLRHMFGETLQWIP